MRWRQREGRSLPLPLRRSEKCADAAGGDVAVDVDAERFGSGSDKKRRRTMKQSGSGERRTCWGRDESECGRDFAARHSPRGGNPR